MNRPDFRGIRILIDSFQALDKDFQRMFDQAAEQEAGLKECCARILREQAVCGLADIPVEELRNARAGIRVAALEQAGYHSLLDLHEADEWRLQSVEGIGEKQAASIRMLIDTFLEKLSASGRIRLTTDIPATNTSAANVSAENTSAMGIPAANTFTTDTPAANIPAAGIAARNTSATGTSSAQAVLAADSRVLITLLARSREAALVRRDAEPLREEFHTQVEAGIQAVEIRNRFRWIFSGRQKKERTLLAVGSLLELDRSPLCRRVRHLLSLYNNAVKISEKEAVADFEKNSAPYYAWLETIFKPAGKLKDAVGFSIHQQEYLCAFLDHGEIEISNNQVENAIRPIVVGRKNWLFCDTQGGANASVIIFSVLETAKANGLNPETYLNHLLTVLPERFAANPKAAIDDLLPWNEDIQKAFGAGG